MKHQFTIENQTLVIYGPAKLQGSEVAGNGFKAALLWYIAGLGCRKGSLVVTHLETSLIRGYYHFIQNTTLGDWYWTNQWIIKNAILQDKELRVFHI